MDLLEDDDDADTAFLSTHQLPNNDMHEDDSNDLHSQPSQFSQLQRLKQQQPNILTPLQPNTSMTDNIASTNSFNHCNPIPRKRFLQDDDD